MDIISAITLTTRSLEMVKAIRDIDKQLNEAELKAKLAELLSNLADTKMALVEVKETLGARDQEIARLKAAFQLREDCVRERDFLYEKSPEGKPRGSPYCPRCEQIDGTMIKLTPDEGMRGNAICPQCKAGYRRVVFYQ